MATYCAEFARAYARRTTTAVDDGGVRVEAEAAVLLWLSNLLQPPASRFVSGYRCRFATAAPVGPRRTVAVSLYLAETLAFAEHTRWESLQFVPVRLVRDETSGATGYGVYKYLRRE